MIKRAADLRVEFSAIKAKRLPRQDKLLLVREIRNGIGEIEAEAARGAPCGYYELEEAGLLLALVDKYIEGR